jgi:hypothetical protein
MKFRQNVKNEIRIFCGNLLLSEKNGQISERK